ncbi:MAG: G1 family glutamic endopeptidase [Candidatus Dormiibacterota bacterium]
MMRRHVTLLAVTGGLLAGAAPAMAGAPALGNGPAHIAVANAAGWSSSNWSGYAGTTTAATSVVGEWQVPTVKATAGNTYSSTWIGIDGFTNSNLIQTGTEQDWAGGHAVYRAWWEILPAAETVISSITVHPGDIFTANIHKGSGTTWHIMITDTTSGKSFSINKTYLGAGGSVEWIQEAPEVGGVVAHLAHYGKTFFINCGFDGVKIAFTAGNRGVMIQGGKQVSTPSEPSSAGNGFEVAYGATTPAPPA